MNNDELNKIFKQLMDDQLNATEIVEFCIDYLGKEAKNYSQTKRIRSLLDMIKDEML
jgi:hypothetical protein